MNRNDAATEFVKMVIRTGFTRSKNELAELLENPTGTDKAHWKSVGRWMHNLPLQNQKNIRFLMEEASISSLFGVLVSLDGATEYHYVGDEPVDFGITLNRYRDFDDAMDNRSAEKVQICPTDNGVNLHDIFLNLLDEVKVGRVNPDELSGND